MLSITLCNWNFLKRNKAYTGLKDFNKGLPITCLKFNQVPTKSKIAPIAANSKSCQTGASSRKSCQKDQKVAKRLVAEATNYSVNNFDSFSVFLSVLFNRT